MVLVDRRGGFHRGAAAFREIARANSPALAAGGRCSTCLARSGSGNGCTGRWPTGATVSIAIVATAEPAICMAARTGWPQVDYLAGSAFGSQVKIATSPGGIAAAK